MHILEDETPFFGSGLAVTADQFAFLFINFIANRYLVRQRPIFVEEMINFCVACSYCQQQQQQTPAIEPELGVNQSLSTFPVNAYTFGSSYY